MPPTPPVAGRAKTRRLRHTGRQIQATLARDPAALERAAVRQACFLVATNVLDPAQLSDQELIATYKAQSHVEMDCTHMTSFVGRGTLISH
jgi:hypothetical protein